MQISFRGAVVAVSASLLAIPASAQSLTPIDQNRAVTAQSSSTDPGGNTTNVGPLVDAVPAGFYGPWTLFTQLTLPDSYITGGQSQMSGWDGLNTITIESFGINLGGGGPPLASATSSATNEFSMTFTISEPVTYQLDAQIACAGPSAIPDTFVDFSVALRLVRADNSVVFEAQTGAPAFNISVVGQTGLLTPGDYTLSLIGSGLVSWTAPAHAGNGAGGGAGGASPILTFTVTPGGGCAVDLNGSGGADVPDIFMFLSLWFAGDPAADWDNSGGAPAVPDIFAFLSAWFAGC